MATDFTGIGTIEAGTPPTAEQVDQIYQLIANAPESEQAELIQDLAEAYPDSGEEVLSAIVAEHPEEAADIAVTVAEAIPK